SNMVYPQPFIVSNFFQEIDNVIKKYVIKLIHNAHYKQMCEFICYKAFQVNLNEIFTFDDDIFEPLVIEFQESEIPTPLQADEVDDDREIYLRSLIERVNQNDILKI
ncbi:8806_t:CDS:1, partial [Funneliformis caledonium]